VSGGKAHSERTGASCRRTPVKYRSNTGPMLVKYRSNIGQYRSNTGQIPVKYWSNTGQNWMERRSERTDPRRRFSRPESSNQRIARLSEPEQLDPANPNASIQPTRTARFSEPTPRFSEPTPRFSEPERGANPRTRARRGNSGRSDDSGPASILTKYRGFGGAE
jgi:hypothetical protein